MKSTIPIIFGIVGILFFLTGCEDTPTISLTATPEFISEGGSTTLSWNSTGVTNCTASGDWSGSKETSGTETISSLTKDSTFNLSCTGDNGSIDTSVKVMIGEPAATSVSLSANPTSISYNGSTTLSWNSVNADSCTATGDWTGSKGTTGSETINSLSSNSTYILSCTGTSGTASDSISVTVRTPSPAVPTVNLTASPTDILYNGSTTLNWSSTNADSCTASGNWSGSKSTSGSEIINSLTQSSTFSLSCTGGASAANDSVTVAVDTSVTPTINLSADPTSVLQNGSTTLSWVSSNTDSCTASGDWSGNKNTSGTETINSLMESSTFNLSCTGTGGSVNDSVSVTIDAEPTPTVNLSADPVSVTYNGSTILTWDSSNADNCVASGDWSGSKDVSGSETINSLTLDSQFILSCSDANGSVDISVDVTIATSGSGTALLSWTPPTQNTDGSALTDLVGYRIRYGITPGNYTKTTTINNPGLTSYQIDNLTPADWYFVISSVNSSGSESVYSNEVSKTVY